MQALQKDKCARRELIERLGLTSGALGRELLCSVSDKLPFLEEIRLRRDAPSSYRVGGRDYLLSQRLYGAELSRILEVLTEGSLYVYSDKLSEGYMTLPSGVRVGVIGGSCPTALVFRMPVSIRKRGNEIYSAFCALGEVGTLIISPPGGGKTTALRALAYHLGRGKDMRRVAVVDTRGEFLASDYSNSCVDIITGLERCKGIEAAVRYMSPEIVVCDEIYSEEDKAALIGAVGAGVTVIATAHGTGEKEVRRRAYIDELFSLGVFSSTITITRKGGTFLYTPEGVADESNRRCLDTFCLSFD